VNTVVSNSNRKYRASRPDGVSLLKKGNHFSTSTNGRLHVDTKPSFPQVAFGAELPYKVSPYEEINGVFFDVAPRTLGIVPGAEKATRKAEKPHAARKARTTRKAPAPGTRPSLSTMRQKG
jgi:hypothetical protein